MFPVVLRRNVLFLPRYELVFDGGYGKAGGTCAWVLYRNGEEILHGNMECDASSSNEAEYIGLINGLIAASRYGCTRLIVRGDSQLVLWQMSGRYRVKAENLQRFHRDAKKLAGTFQSVRFRWQRRTAQSSRRADALARQGRRR